MNLSIVDVTARELLLYLDFSTPRNGSASVTKKDVWQYPLVL